jgi:putative chitinase
MINRDFFFDQCQRTLFTRRLSAAQKSGMTAILDAWEPALSRSDDRWLAYALGTTFHETQFTMQPIREHGDAAYFTKMYDPNSSVPKRAALARRMNARPGDGPIFYGRGFVQLTWRVNYAKMGQTYRTDLTSGAAAADGALEPDLAAKIMFKGMIDGIFTGKKLADYFNPRTADWKNARRIVNGLDHADDIATYAKKFYAAISYTTN